VSHPVSTTWQPDHRPWIAAEKSFGHNVEHGHVMNAGKSGRSVMAEVDGGQELSSVECHTPCNVRPADRVDSFVSYLFDCLDDFFSSSLSQTTLHVPIMGVHGVYGVHGAHGVGACRRWVERWDGYGWMDGMASTPSCLTQVEPHSCSCSCCSCSCVLLGSVTSVRQLELTIRREGRIEHARDGHVV
jgi:hypothetical protein